MPVVDIATLKSYFNNGDVPIEDHYFDLIDTTFPGNHTHPGTDITSAVANAVEADTLDGLHASNFHRNDQNISNPFDILIGGGLTVGSQTDYASFGGITYLGDLKTRKNSVTYNIYCYRFLTTYISSLTYTNYVTSSFSKIDKSLATEFSGVPSNAKALLLSISIKDSGSISNDCYFIVGPNATPGDGSIVRVSGIANGFYTTSVVIANSNNYGVLYFEAKASGTNTMTVNIRCFGYFI